MTQNGCQLECDRVLQQTKKIQCDIQRNRRPNRRWDSCFGYPSTLGHRSLPQKILAFAVTRRGTTHAMTQEAHLWWTVTHLTMHKARNLPSFFFSPQHTKHYSQWSPPDPSECAHWETSRKTGCDRSQSGPTPNEFGEATLTRGTVAEGTLRLPRKSLSNEHTLWTPS